MHPSIFTLIISILDDNNLYAGNEPARRLCFLGVCIILDICAIKLDAESGLKIEPGASRIP